MAGASRGSLQPISGGVFPVVRLAIMALVSVTIAVILWLSPSEAAYFEHENAPARSLPPNVAAHPRLHNDSSAADGCSALWGGRKHIASMYT